MATVIARAGPANATAASDASSFRSAASADGGTSSGAAAVRPILAKLNSSAWICEPGTPYALSCERRLSIIAGGAVQAGPKEPGPAVNEAMPSSSEVPGRVPTMIDSS